MNHQELRRQFEAEMHELRTAVGRLQETTNELRHVLERLRQETPEAKAQVAYVQPGYPHPARQALAKEADSETLSPRRLP
jgi:uncharacterized protein YdhG (YjbR/CyaY superfamily)